MDVYSNVKDLTVGTKIETGNIEFWPNNYGVGNVVGIEGGSDSLYDFGDEMAPPTNGYGSMQVHNFGARQTLFAINRWNGGGSGADIGIGNSDGETRDWTFRGNGGSYSSKRLRIYVREN
jgi:sialate O-acetylesterase